MLLGALAVAALFVLDVSGGCASLGAGFNSDKVIEISGTIKEFQFTNPHTWIQVIVEDAKGAKVEWSLEWGSPNSLGRQGIRPSTFPPGAKVTHAAAADAQWRSGRGLRRREVRRRENGRAMGLIRGAALRDVLNVNRPRGQAVATLRPCLRRPKDLPMASMRRRLNIVFSIPRPALAPVSGLHDSGCFNLHEDVRVE